MNSVFTLEVPVSFAGFEDINLNGDSLRLLGTLLADAHRFAVEVSQRVLAASTEDLRDEMMRALGVLLEAGAISEDERRFFDRLADAITASDSVAAGEAALAEAGKMENPFAILLHGIARDSIRRDRAAAGAGHPAQLPPGAQARTSIRVFASWAADTVAGAAAGAATCATVVGAVVVGALVGSAASAAVLA